MNSRPTISVIVPTYNRVESLVLVLEAIFNQTYPPAEVIVADDGSTDDTLDVLRQTLWSGLKLMQLPHSGLPAVARNAALKEAVGEWVAFCDSDDLWAFNKLERQVQSLEADSRALCTNAWVQNEQGVKSLMFSQLPKFLDSAQILKSNQIINSSVLIQKKLLDEVGGIPISLTLRGLEDYATWLRVTTIAPFQALSEPLVTYAPTSANALRANTAYDEALTAPLAWLDFLAWMRQRGEPLTLSESLINVALPRAIAANLKLSAKN
jgi:glycosyltransferase involved in cell wall biosynthesis